MPMHDFNPLSQNNVPEYGKKGKDSRESRLPIDDKERHMVDLETIGKIADASTTLVCMGDDDDLVAAIDELGRELIDVAFNAAGLGEEEVADHGDVVGHYEGFWLLLLLIEEM